MNNVSTKLINITGPNYVHVATSRTREFVRQDFYVHPCDVERVQSGARPQRIAYRSKNGGPLRGFDPCAPACDQMLESITNTKVEQNMSKNKQVFQAVRARSWPPEPGEEETLGTPCEDFWDAYRLACERVSWVSRAFYGVRTPGGDYIELAEDDFTEARADSRDNSIGNRLARGETVVV